MEKLVFKINVHLINVLSQSYNCTEKALKELVDNAWDADSDTVIITLPEPMTNAPIIIEDNGAGMSLNELKTAYLDIGRNRRIRVGTLTLNKKRRVKGHKGVGKFAGFGAAKTMKLETWKCGNRYEFEITVSDQYDDLTEMPLNITSVEDNSKMQGTRITLKNLKQNLKFPSAEALRKILLREYGKNSDFCLVINEKKLDIDDIKGAFSEQEIDIPNVGKIKLRLTLSKNQVPDPGIIFRIGGKIVGEPTFFDLEKMDDFPSTIFKNCVGEIESEDLLDDVTFDWGTISQNSKKYQLIKEQVLPILKEKFKTAYEKEIRLREAQLKSKLDRALKKLPEYKRIYTRNILLKACKRYNLGEKQLTALVETTLNALESSDHLAILEHLSQINKNDVNKLAEALKDFGLIEIAQMNTQAQTRLKFLDYLLGICDVSTTLEKDMHQAFESNLWILGAHYSYFKSNTGLQSIIEETFNMTYRGGQAKKRPDLFLIQNFNEEHLLIEFKRPSHTLNYKDYQQATAYRNDLQIHIPTEKISIYLIGGQLGDDLPLFYSKEADVQFISYKKLISNAQQQIEWLLSDLSTPTRVNFAVS